jgi:hypothetical protein
MYRYMWSSMGRRDRSVRIAELPLQQRRCYPSASHTPAAGRIGWRMECRRDRSDLTQQTHKDASRGGMVGKRDASRRVPHSVRPLSLSPYGDDVTTGESTQAGGVGVERREENDGASRCESYE